MLALTYFDLDAAFPLQASLMLSSAVALSLTPDGWRFHRVMAPLSFSLRSLHALAMANSSVQFSAAAKKFPWLLKIGFSTLLLNSSNDIARSTFGLCRLTSSFRKHAYTICSDFKGCKNDKFELIFFFGIYAQNKDCGYLCFEQNKKIMFTLVSSNFTI